MLSRQRRLTMRRTIAALHQKTKSKIVRWQIAGWVALTSIAAGLRLYRPLASANLGFSDTYVHLYFLKLLEDGRQVDPQWGPYPHGMPGLQPGSTPLCHALNRNFFVKFVYNILPHLFPVLGKGFSRKTFVIDIHNGLGIRGFTPRPFGGTH